MAAEQNSDFRVLDIRISLVFFSTKGSMMNTTGKKNNNTDDYDDGDCFDCTVEESRKLDHCQPTSGSLLYVKKKSKEQTIVVIES